jgi:LacI family transcriptional regulator
MTEKPLTYAEKSAIISISSGNVAGNDTEAFLSAFEQIMKRSKQSITIQDVASAAGVSVSTVSRVLNDKDDIAPETYQRVKSIISDLGYTSNLAARSMRGTKMNVIGLIMPDAGEPFPIEVMKGVNHAVAALDYDLIIYTCGDTRKHFTADRERKFVSLLSNSITDGLVVVTPEATHFNASGPIVAVDPHYEITEYPSVTSTNKDGAIRAMNYLLKLGHKRIAFISGRSDLHSAKRRLLGYYESLEQAGISINPQYVAQGDFTAAAGLQAARQLLNLPNRPTAIFAANDQTAFGVYQAAEEAGLSIPRDLSVIGFDNTPESAQAHPGLTTVDQSIQEIGKIAVQMLVKLIEGETLESKIIKTPTNLVIRDSCQAR